MGSICQLEFDKTKEYSWSIKIIKTKNKLIIGRYSSINFDLNSSKNIKLNI